jgi:hypothetical protein
MTCPASLFGPQEDQSSAYADEGTAAHSLAAECWLLGSEPASYVGKKVGEFEVTEEMADAVQIFLDTITATISRLSESGETPQVMIETQLVSEPFPDFGGTADCLVYTSAELVVIDFKYGAGVSVEVVGNLQLLCYAVLACVALDLAASNYRLVVVQPRKEHPDGPVREWAPSLGEFRSQTERIYNAIETATDGKFSGGEHCRWCPRKVHCPELYQLTIEQARTEFKDVEADMTPERAAEVMQKAKAVSIYIDAVESWAHGQMEKGVSVPGFKLVYAYANREYCVDEPELLKRLKKLKVAKADAFVTTLKSPAQLEKVTGKEFVNAICDRALKGTTVVPETDNRPAVVRQTAADEFANVKD